MLLQAALLQGDVASAAWRAWRTNVDFDQLEPGAFALLPLLYHNLQPQGIADPWLVKCKGIYRRTWAQNQLHLQQVTALLRVLEAAGIQPLLLTDAALLLAHYPDYGLRMLNQVELAIPAIQGASTLAALQQAGWRASHSTQPSWSANPNTSQSYRFQHQLADGLTVRCHMVARNQYPHRERDLWQTAIPASINQVATLTQPATDLLLAICTRQRPAYSIQWVADALILLRNSTPIHWEELLTLAAQQARTVQLRAALTYLYEQYEAPVPATILQQLATMPIHPFEQREADLHRHLPSATTPLTVLWTDYQRRKWWHAQAGLSAESTSWLAYLQQHFGLDSPWQIPLHLSKACLRRLPAIGTAHSTHIKGNI